MRNCAVLRRGKLRASPRPSAAATLHALGVRKALQRGCQVYVKHAKERHELLHFMHAFHLLVVLTAEESEPT